MLPPNEDAAPADYNAGHIGVETVQFPSGADQRVAGADLLGQRIGIIQLLLPCLLIRHGDAEAANRYVADTGQQVFQALGVQRQINRIHGFAAKRGIHHHGESEC